MHAVPAVHLSVQLPSSAGRGLAMPRLTQEIFGQSETLPAPITYNWRGPQTDTDAEPIIELSGVAPARYSVELHGGGDSNRSAAIDAASDARIDLSAATGMADVSGKVVMASGDELPDRVNISLRASDGRDGGSERLNPDGSFTIHGIPPGSYEVSVAAPGTSLAVTHLTATGAPTEGNVVRIGTAPVALSATLVEGSTTVTGFATRDGKLAAGAMVLLVPRSPGTERELFRRDQSNSDGSFQLNRVVPGQYTLVAIEQGWELDWARPEVIAHYLPKGVKTIVPSRTKNFAITERIEVQPK
jgi:Carboxypeptidase regulatory-like domain